MRRATHTSAAQTRTLSRPVVLAAAVAGRMVLAVMPVPVLLLEAEADGRTALLLLVVTVATATLVGALERLPALVEVGRSVL